MTMFTYNSGVPFATNNPSNDQPQMLINTVSNFGIWNVDHVGFNTTNTTGNPNASGGQHLRVTFNGKNPPTFSAPIDPISALYTLSGVATTNAELRFLNGLNIAFPVSLIRAYGVFDTNGNVVSSQSINLTNVGTWNSGTGYSLLITANAITGNTYGVLVTANQSGLNPTWSSAYVYSSTPGVSFTVGFRRSDTAAFGQPSNGFTCIVFQL
jgi:hypothetical protein